MTIIWHKKKYDKAHNEDKRCDYIRLDLIDTSIGKHHNNKKLSLKYN